MPHDQQGKKESKVLTVDDVLEEKGCKELDGVGCDLGGAEIYVCRGKVVVRLGDLKVETVYVIKGDIVSFYNYEIGKTKEAEKVAKQLRVALED